MYTLYGKEVHEQIGKDPKYAHIRLPVAEHPIRITIEGVPVLGYIDTFDDKTCDFGEYKTAINRATWTPVTVHKHDQLPFYSLLIQEAHGKKINKTFLVWLETVFENTDRKIGGVKIGGERKLILTGKFQIFERKIYQYERDRMKKWIKESAEEISNDYTQWQYEQGRNRSVSSGVGEEIAREESKT